MAPRQERRERGAGTKMAGRSESTAGAVPAAVRGDGRSLAASEEAIAFLAGTGYVRVDTPIVEESELFVRKGGGEMAGLLYSFREPSGRRLSLRPEFTTSVIRLFVESGGSGEAVRWSYAGPVFRYDRDGGGGLRQFTQVGAEIIGAGSAEADAEVVRTAVDGLGRLGVRGASVRLGHIRTLSRIFSAFGLSESSRGFVTGNLGRLKRGRTTAAALSERARAAGLVGDGRDGGGGAELAREALQGLALDGGSRGPMGRRTVGEIMARLESKARHPRDPAEMDRALELACRLARLEGPAGATMERARSLAASAGAPADSLDPLGEVVAALDAAGMADEAVTLDLGMARGMAYYTGAQFDLAAPGAAALGGGGRYDGLVETLGGPAVPALGFAYDMEAVAAAAGTR